MDMVKLAKCKRCKRLLLEAEFTDHLLEHLFKHKIYPVKLNDTYKKFIFYGKEL